MGEQISNETLLKFLKAILLVKLELDAESEKPELILKRAGFSVSEIAELLDRKYDTVAKTISRAGKK